MPVSRALGRPRLRRILQRTNALGWARRMRTHTPAQAFKPASTKRAQSRQPRRQPRFTKRAAHPWALHVASPLALMGLGTSIRAACYVLYLLIAATRTQTTQIHKNIKVISFKQREGKYKKTKAMSQCISHLNVREELALLRHSATDWVVFYGRTSWMAGIHSFPREFFFFFKPI
jgi:hypothetical protein